VSEPRRIFILDGHPDGARERFVHQLAEAYEEGAVSAGHQVIRKRLADLDVPLLRSKDDYQGDPPEHLRECLDAVDWAQHVTIVHPLWLGSMPAALKGLFEQLVRPGFAFSTNHLGRWPVRFWEGKTARIVVTMGMSKPAYWWFYGVGGSRSPQRVVLSTSGFRRVRTTLIGRAETMSPEERKKWVEKVRALGRTGS
jgi:putative NADPH-quinone reductase